MAWPSVRLTLDHRLPDDIDRGKLRPQKTGPQVGGPLYFEDKADGLC